MRGLAAHVSHGLKSFVLWKRPDEWVARMFATRFGNSKRAWQQTCLVLVTRFTEKPAL